jgi:two-component system NtrC family sensor kinase
MYSSKNISAYYHVFRDISTSIHSSTSVKQVLDLVCRKSTEAVNAKGALLRILSLKTDRLELRSAYGLSDRYLSKGHVSTEKVITDLCRLNRVIIIDMVLENPRVQYPKEAWEEGIRMMLDLPLTIGENVVGILRIFFSEKRQFSEEELNFLISIAEQSSLAISKARLIEAQQTQYDQLATQTEKLSALGRVAAGIAHEINNPLAGILLYSTNMVKKVPEEGPFKEGLQVIIDETIRCRSIIQELLEFSREREPEQALGSMNRIIDKALSILENQFRLHHIRVEKRLSEAMPDVYMDANQMQQVIINLLVNAMESIQEQGKISIQSRLDPGKRWEIVEIEDTGPGIPTEHIGKIFEPFFSTKSKGTGLGLAVSYGIVRSHNGEIEVSSEAGKGTSFTIKIPLLRSAEPIKKEGT